MITVARAFGILVSLCEKSISAVTRSNEINQISQINAYASREIDILLFSMGKQHP